MAVQREVTQSHKRSAYRLHVLQNELWVSVRNAVCAEHELTSSASSPLMGFSFVSFFGGISGYLQITAR